MSPARPITGRFLRLAWAVLFLAAAVSQITYTIDLMLQISGRYPVVGLAPGERVSAYAVRSRQPGDTIPVASGPGERLVKVQAAPLPASRSYVVVAGVIMPAFCLLLGFWVAAVRLRDPRAWMMLGMLLGISQLTRGGVIDPLGWGFALGLPALLLLSVATPLWAVSMMLFGIYFPNRWSLDRKLPWLKWVLLAAPASLAALAAAHDVGQAFDVALPLGWLTEKMGFVALCPCISIFFAAIAQKHSEATHSDDRRRLSLLYFGATAALTPMFLLFLFDLIVRHRTPSDADGPWLLIALIAMMLFPLTLAYIVVVERAMDVRMVVRQGLQYALAAKGVGVLQGLLVFAVIIMAATMSTGASRPRRLTYIALGIAVTLRIRELGERLRRWVDRKFFREAFNAEQILRELSEQVRGILDRDALVATVARRISQSLHVDHVAIEIRGQTGHSPISDFTPELRLPLPGRKELLGYLALGPKKSEEPYSPSDRSLLETVATQTGLALENANLSDAIAHEVAQRELLSREIEIAREVQQRLFPQNLPEIAALEYAGHCRPAQGVGGDYYDFLTLASGRLGVAIGDVSGKGIPAALLMASLQASVRGQSQGSANVAELMTGVNRLVCDASPENRYATFFYAQFDPAAHKLLYSNGGHNAPIVLRGGEVLRLETGGPPVGLFPFSRYQQEEVALHPGDLLILYTDGVSEAENPAQDEWGEDALIAAARAASALPPVAMIQRIIEAADAFASGAPQHDDMTLVIARVG